MGHDYALMCMHQHVLFCSLLSVCCSPHGPTFTWWGCYGLMMEIYAAPKLSKYTTALGAYNIKSFTYEINQHTHTHTYIHTHTCMHIHTRTHTHTHTHTHKQVVRNLYRGIYIRETRVEG